MKNLNFTIVALWVALSLKTFPASAFEHKAVHLGVGIYSQNALFETSSDEKGEGSLLGALSYPLHFKFDYNLVSEWFVAPQLSHTLFSRMSAGDTAENKFTHLVFQVGKNMSGFYAPKWDWYIGPGLMRYQIKGKGGTVVMNNGTGMATFARPGRSATIQKVTMNLGSSLSYERSRFGLDLIMENLFSNERRTQSLMLSYAYRFGGGGF